uniref:Alpha-carbonic anhydrase domain-containing protein n=1 Tax=Gadus morhua TaxID=8049 RepID=A0A8C5CTI7_GADMO
MYSSASQSLSHSTDLLSLSLSLSSLSLSLSLSPPPPPSLSLSSLSLSLSHLSLSLSLSPPPPPPPLALTNGDLDLVFTTFLYHCVWVRRANMDWVALFFPLTVLLSRWIVVPAAEETYWTYTGLVGQSQWSTYFPECSGYSQSPIDVVTSQTKHDPTLSPLTPLGYSQHGNQPFSLYNNGHTVVIELPDWMGLRGLPWLYTAAQMHLHWGSGGPGHGGSEHTIDGESTDAELHLVHYNSDLYPNISTAMTKENGLAVLGILIETGPENNQAFDNILNYLGRVRHADQKVFIPAFNIEALLPGNMWRYYRYKGSLTTPPCDQTVLWTLFQERISISQAQLLKLETSLYSSREEEPDKMLLQDNYRSTQPPNNRVVLTSFSEGSLKDLSSGEVTAIVVGVMCGCVGLAVIIRFIVKTIRFLKHFRNERAVNRANMSEKQNEQKQDVALSLTSGAGGPKEEPLSSLKAEP